LFSHIFVAYKEDGSIDFDSENVPFRMSRTLAHFCNPIFLDGTFTSMMTAAAMCFGSCQVLPSVVSNLLICSLFKERIRNLLALYMQDELNTYNISDPMDIDGNTNATLEQTKLKAQANVNFILDRIKRFSPIYTQTEVRHKIRIFL
jgi:hypothetical protein